MAEAKEVPGKPAGMGRRYYHSLQKDYATFLETSEESGGEHTLIEIEVAPGGGNEPHYHKTYEEHFEVIEGSLEVLVGRETRVLRPGERAVAGRNVLHRFRNPTGSHTRFLVELRPGHAGFEKAIKAGYGLAADGLTGPTSVPKNIYHLAVLLDWSEMRVPGLFTIAEPLFRLLAARARRKGIDADLEARYCR
jgi:quercetin dioxygenase-like cupin family protein